MVVQPSTEKNTPMSTYSLMPPLEPHDKADTTSSVSELVMVFHATFGIPRLATIHHFRAQP